MRATVAGLVKRLPAEVRRKIKHSDGNFVIGGAGEFRQDKFHLRVSRGARPRPSIKGLFDLAEKTLEELAITSFWRAD